jgi:AcrR family transcriptional regulator
MNPETKHNTRKQELFAKITEIISEEGYANLTVREICHKLAISTGTFYHYFPGKGDLVWVLFADIDDYFKNHVVSKFIDYEPDNLITYCIEYGKYAKKNGVETCRLISVAPLNSSSHNYLDENRSIFQTLLQIIIRGVNKKQFILTNSPEETARMLIVILRGYSSDWAKRNGNYDLPEVLRAFAELFCKSIV